MLDNFSQFFISNFPTVYHFMPLSFQLLVGPFLYFYVLSFLDSDFKFDLKNALHLVPFALFTLYLAVIFYSLPFEEKQQILRYGSLFSWREYTIFMSIIQVQSILYIVVAVESIFLAWISNSCVDSRLQRMSRKKQLSSA